MKKPWLKILLLIILVAVLSACGGQNAPSGSTPVPGSTSTLTPAGVVEDATPTGAPPATPAAAMTATTTGTPEDIPVTGADCTAPAELTPSSTEGPYYSEGSPENASLAGDLPGTRLLLTGAVLDTNCQPIPGAWIDFWQADSQGVYDNNGYTLRGHQFTDAQGRYRLETVVPGEYPGRTEHIHVKVQASNGPVLTSQLYFPDVSQNQSDNIFIPDLVVKVTSASDTQMEATFNFIVATE